MVAPPAFRLFLIIDLVAADYQPAGSVHQRWSILPSMEQLPCRFDHLREQSVIFKKWDVKT